jgi:hypothetical protein
MEIIDLGLFRRVLFSPRRLSRALATKTNARIHIMVTLTLRKALCLCGLMARVASHSHLGTCSAPLNNFHRAADFLSRARARARGLEFWRHTRCRRTRTTRSPTFVYQHMLTFHSLLIALTPIFLQEN